MVKSAKMGEIDVKKRMAAWKRIPEERRPAWEAWKRQWPEIQNCLDVIREGITDAEAEKIVEFWENKRKST